MDCLEKLETGGSWAEYGHARHERRDLTQGVPGPEVLMRRLVGGSVSGPQVVGRCASNCWPAPRRLPASRTSRGLWPGTASFPDRETTPRCGPQCRPGIVALSCMQGCAPGLPAPPFSCRPAVGCTPRRPRPSDSPVHFRRCKSRDLPRTTREHHLPGDPQQFAVFGFLLLLPLLRGHPLDRLHAA